MPLGAHRAALFGIAGAGGLSVKLLDEQDGSSVSAIAFTSKINAAYKEYVFVFYDIHPQTDGVDFEFQCDINGGNNGYNDLDTCHTFPRAYVTGTTTGTYDHLDSHAQGGTSNYAKLSWSSGNAVSECITGELHLINPASTTMKTNFWSDIQNTETNSRPSVDRSAGYFMTGAQYQSINAINFKFSSGTFSGKIKMWGYK
jgi:hypothetical protein